MSQVKLSNVIKRFDKTQVIHGVELTIDSGEFCVFVGPSGCGKSTLLRMLAGLEEITEGSLHIGDCDVTKIDSAERGVAMVFQTYALYPHMTVEENMGFGLKMNKVDKAVIKSKVDEVADILQLGEYMKRKPKVLSGGQRQRVAIGRALVRDPEIFLFDEPLSNLDAELRVEMRSEIARLHQEIGATMVYVTHDQVEAMTLANKIVVLRDGRIEQVGAPMDLYNDPDNKFVAGFIGSPAMNFVTGTIEDGHLNCDAIASRVEYFPNGENGVVTVGIRPEDITIVSGDTLTVEFVEHLGGTIFVHANTVNGERMNIEVKGQQGYKRGDKIAIEIAEKDLRFFDKKSEQRLR